VIAALVVAAAVASVPVRAAVTVTDDAGQTLTLAGPAQRIVSLAPHATELLFAAGAGDRVVGVSAFSDYPAVARVLPQVSGGVRLDIEQVVALKPDLAVGWSSGNARSDLDALRRFGIPVFIAEPKKLDDVAATLVTLGRVVGREVEAQAAAEQYRARLATLREDYRERTPVRVFVMISAQPLMTLNHAHLFQDVLRLCGGRNVFAARDTLAPSVSYESVLIEDPDVILFSSSLGTEQAMREWWRERIDLRAVRLGRVYAMPADTTLRQTPRVLDGAARVCAALDAARQPPSER
jgi:iron complex transport system substrate-binding protein